MTPNAAVSHRKAPKSVWRPASIPPDRLGELMLPDYLAAIRGKRRDGRGSGGEEGEEKEEGR